MLTLFPIINQPNTNIKNANTVLFKERFSSRSVIKDSQPLKSTKFALLVLVQIHNRISVRPIIMFAKAAINHC